MNLESTFGTRAPVIGMVHLDPLPGSPGAAGEIASVIAQAVNDAETLARGGVDGLVIENLGDAPYYPDDVPKHVVAAMTRATTEVARSTDLPIGINVLRNDTPAALAVAAATEAAFVRANVHVGVRVTDQGVVTGRAHETVRLRDRIAKDVAIFADFASKHSAAITGKSPTAENVLDLVERGHADGIIVSGSSTGRPVNDRWLESVVGWRDEYDLAVPVLVGSGVDRSTIDSVIGLADGVIVGTALKRNGEVHNAVDEARVAELVSAADDHR